MCCVIDDVVCADVLYVCTCVCVCESINIPSVKVLFDPVLVVRCRRVDSLFIVGECM